MGTSTQTIVRIPQRAVSDDQQILSQAVVQFGGDPFAFAFLRLDQLLREGLLRGLRLLQPPDVVLITEQHRAHNAETRPEPGFECNKPGVCRASHTKSPARAGLHKQQTRLAPGFTNYKPGLRRVWGQSCEA